MLWLRLLCIACAAAAAQAIYTERGTAPRRVAKGHYIVTLRGKRGAAVQPGIAQVFREGHPFSGSPDAAAARAAAAVGGMGRSTVPDAAARAAAREQVRAYAQGLVNNHASVLAGAIGGGDAAARGTAERLISQHFTVALNGFAAGPLSRAQVEALARSRDVLSVTPVTVRRLATFTTPTLLGLDGSDGVWKTQFASASDAASDVLIGIIDGGISTSQGVFAARTVPYPSNPWPVVGLGTGACAPENGSQPVCTDGKVMACRMFDQGADWSLATYGGELKRDPSDLGSCQDVYGHGTHVSSTAAGEYHSPAVNNGFTYSPGMSGMANGAALASYKVCWNDVNVTDNSTTGDCWDPDIISAIEAAVLDGVWVINMSIGAPAQLYGWFDPIWEAFKSAAAAGVFVATSNGNYGPDSGSSGFNGEPWVASVGAGTTGRQFIGNFSLSGAPTSGPWGGSLSPGSLPIDTPMFINKTTDDTRLCAPGSLGNGTAAGRIALCARGTYALFDKAVEAASAGAVGVIIYNTPTSSQSFFTVPADIPVLIVDQASGAAIVAAVEASPSALGTMFGATVQLAEAPAVADFSSRGPSLTDHSYVLKPDILAPGVDIFAAVPLGSMRGPTSTGTFLSGTSMASPHIAGIAALIISKHPRRAGAAVSLLTRAWTPAMVKSAIITTASQVTNKGNPIPTEEGGDGSTATPFDMGGGQVVPSKALDPGLVYNTTLDDFDRYTCTTYDKAAYNAAIVSHWYADNDENLWYYAIYPGVTPSYCSSRSVCPSAKACKFPQGLIDANWPTFSIAAVKKSASARRTVTFVGAAGPATFKYKLDTPANTTLSVKAGSGGALSFKAPFDTASYTLTVKVVKGSTPGWSFGSITWTDSEGKWSVRSPIAVEIAG